MDGTAPVAGATTSRRTLLAIVVGVALLPLANVAVRITLLEKFLWTEDFLPGAPPDMVLEPKAWSTTCESITFAVLVDNGSGGRNATADAGADPVPS